VSSRRACLSFFSYHDRFDGQYQSGLRPASPNFNQGTKRGRINGQLHPCFAVGPLPLDTVQEPPDGALIGFLRADVVPGPPKNAEPFAGTNSAPTVLPGFRKSLAQRSAGRRAPRADKGHPPGRRRTEPRSVAVVSGVESQEKWEKTQKVESDVKKVTIISVIRRR
jgi:hypothetical protein